MAETEPSYLTKKTKSSKYNGPQSHSKHFVNEISTNERQDNIRVRVPVNMSDEYNPS